MRINNCIVIGMIALACTAVLGGCKSDEQKALDKIAERGQTAKVRLINLTDSVLTMEWRNQELEAGITHFSSSSFRNIGTKKKEIVISSPEGVILTAEFDAEPAGLYNVIVMGAGDDVRYTMFESSEVWPQPSTNFEAFFINEAGKPIGGTVTVTNGEDSYEISDSSGKMQLALGDYVLEGLDDEIGEEIEDDSFYTLFVIETQNGNRIGMLMRNALRDKPMASGSM